MKYYNIAQLILQLFSNSSLDILMKKKPLTVLLKKSDAGSVLTRVKDKHKVTLNDTHMFIYPMHGYDGSCGFVGGGFD